MSKGEDVMNSELVEIDLVFNGFSDDLVNQTGLVDFKSRLINSQVWSKDINLWLSFIRNQNEMRCPEVIRKASNFSLGLEFIDDLKIKELNQKWRDTPESTDVLSFPMIDFRKPYFFSECIELGDIFVSVTTALRQANDYGNDLVTELRWLVSHGFLHLLGWEHSDEESLNEILILQEHLLKMNDNL